MAFNLQLQPVSSGLKQQARGIQALLHKLIHQLNNIKWLTLVLKAKCQASVAFALSAVGGGVCDNTPTIVWFWTVRAQNKATVRK